MDHDTLRQQIVLLETRIDELAQAWRRCRKVALAAKLTMLGGSGALLAGMVVPLAPAVMIAAGACVIGGVVTLGSNTTTARETAGAIEQAERQRAELIDQLQLTALSAGAWAPLPD